MQVGSQKIVRYSESNRNFATVLGETQSLLYGEMISCTVIYSDVPYWFLEKQMRERGTKSGVKSIGISGDKSFESPLLYGTLRQFIVKCQTLLTKKCFDTK